MKEKQLEKVKKLIMLYRNSAASEGEKTNARTLGEKIIKRYNLNISFDTYEEPKSYSNFRSSRSRAYEKAYERAYEEYHNSQHYKDHISTMMKYVFESLFTNFKHEFEKGYNWHKKPKIRKYFGPFKKFKSDNPNDPLTRLRTEVFESDYYKHQPHFTINALCKLHEEEINFVKKLANKYGHRMEDKDLTSLKVYFGFKKIKILMHIFFIDLHYSHGNTLITDSIFEEYIKDGLYVVSNDLELYYFGGKGCQYAEV